jgi:hypothetical protein
MTSHRAVLGSVFILIGRLISVPALEGQDVRHPSWTVTAAVEVLRAGDRSSGYGPALAIRHNFGPRWGAELKAAAPAFGSGNGGGAAIELGATYTAFKGRTEFGAMLGVTGFLVGDDSELVGGGVGVVLAGHLTRWFTPGVGLTAGANLRTAIGVYPAAYAGLAVRF